uniref:HrTT-1 protein n=1 Tax=Halocynthia roretzi TaxID=7729 RepID=O44228_HALRO|nr:HrTT-1 [Halocynthia roretzi]
MLIVQINMKLSVFFLALLPLVARTSFASNPNVLSAEENWSNLVGTEEIENVNSENEFSLATEEERSNFEENNVILSEEKVVEEITARWDIGLDPDANETFSVKKAVKAVKIIPGKIMDKIVLKKPFRMALLRTHNARRAIAQPKAANMRRMTWDMELERLAVAYSRKCIYEHNPRTKHSRFEYVGENLFISTGYAFTPSLMKHAVEAWDDEKQYYDYETKKCQRGKMCGHYTQVVWADTFKMGCGVTRCSDIDVRGRRWKNAILLVCNYGPGGNYPTHPFVTAPSCSKCAPTDICRRNLCNNVIRDRLKLDRKDIKWSEWTTWSSCSKSCGVGSTRRERQCNTFVPGDCKDFPSEVKFCVKKPCKAAMFGNGGSFSYNIVMNQGDKLLKGSLQQALQKHLSGFSFGNFVKRRGRK